MEILVGALAAWGLLMLLWTLLGVCLLPLERRKGVDLTVLVQDREHSDHLERYVKGLLWLRDLGLVWWRIIVIKKDKNNGTGLLPDCFGQVDVMSRDEFKDWMDKQEWTWEQKTRP